MSDAASSTLSPDRDDDHAATPLGLLARLRLLAADIKLAHSVFALPFALLAAFLAAGSAGRLPSLMQGTLVVICMVLARTVAMSVNRWADREIDAGNPRTVGRAVPSGRLSPAFVFMTAIYCGLGFIIATSLFWVVDANAWPLLLSPLVLAWLAGYSFMKRYTMLCHLYLGSALALSPVAAVIAIEPGYLVQPIAWIIALMVMCWVAGFDIIYALQDVEIDQSQGLHSLPSRLGIEPALWVSRALHLASASALVLATWLSTQLAGLFTIGVVLVIALLALEHALVWRSEQRRIDVAFFTVNGVISVLLGILGIVDVIAGLT